MGSAAFDVEYQPRCLKAIEKKQGDGAEWARKEYEATLDKASEAIKELPLFCEEALESWGSAEDRVLGHVLYAPPIGVGAGADQHTEDFAIIELDPFKIDAKNFKGNIIDFGTKLKFGDFHRMMEPDPPNRKTFMYLCDRLMKLQGTI